jgi:hypothetical protein
MSSIIVFRVPHNGRNGFYIPKFHIGLEGPITKYLVTGIWRGNLRRKGGLTRIKEAVAGITCIGTVIAGKYLRP